MLASQMLGSCREMDFLDRETWGLLSLDLDVNLLRPRMDVEVVVGGSGKGTRWNESGLGKRHPGAPPATPIDLMGIILAHWGLQRRTREKTRGKPMVHHESGLIRDSRGCMASMASMASPNSVQPRVGVTDPPLPSSGARPPEMSRSFRAWRGMAEDLPSECLWLT